MNIDNKKVLFKQLLDSTEFKKLKHSFLGLGCKIENINSKLIFPIYINLDLPKGIKVPFICINEPTAMIEGELSLWVGIDDNNCVDSVSITDHSTPEMLAKSIKAQINSDSVLISGFSTFAFELKQLIDQLNNQEHL